MKLKVIPIALLALATIVGCNSIKPSAKAPEISYKHFGSPTPADAAPLVTVNQLMANPGNYDGKAARVSGTVAKVCAKKGCWLTLADADQEGLFVKFTCPIDGRLIPADAVGKQAIVHGTIRVKEITEEEARHYKEDAGASAEEIAKIVGPQKQVTVAAPSAEIAGLTTN